MRSPDELTTLFRQRNLKVTPQRRAVFDALHGEAGHLTADAVWARVRAHMPTVSLRTVYQALNDLVDLGEVRPVTVGSGGTRFDPNTGGHDHFVCRACGRVDDVIATRPQVLIGPAAAPRDDDAGTGAPCAGEPDGAALTVADAPPGCSIDSAEIVFRGLCATCGASAGTASTTAAEPDPT